MLSNKISGLAKYLHSNGEIKVEKFQNAYLVVDLVYFCKFIAYTHKIQFQYGGSNIHVVTKMQVWLNAFKDCHIEPLFIVSSSLPRTYPSLTCDRGKNNAEIIEKLAELKSEINQNKDADEVSFKKSTRGIENIFIDLLTSQGSSKIVYLTPYAGASAAIISFAAYLDCPVLITDSYKYMKFFTDPGFNVAKNFRYLWSTSSYPMVEKGALIMEVFTPAESFLTSFPPRKWPLVATLLHCTSTNRLRIPLKLYKILRNSPPHQSRTIEAKLGAIRQYFMTKCDPVLIFDDFINEQVEKMREQLEEHLHREFVELYPSVRFAMDIASVLHLESPFSDKYFDKYPHFSCQEEVSFRAEILALLSGARFYPAESQSIALVDTGIQFTVNILRKNAMRWVSALYFEEGRQFNVQLEDYGNLASSFRCSAKLRQMIYGIFLEIERGNPTVVKGYDPNSKTISEWFNEFGRKCKSNLPISPIKRDHKSTVTKLLLENGDLDLREVEDLPLLSWVRSVVFIGIYWYHYTGLNEAKVKDSVFSTFICLALFCAFSTREVHSGALYGKLFDFCESYSNELKEASSDKRLNMSIVHALAELRYLPIFFKYISDLMPNQQNRMQFLSSWQLFPHNRLFHWMACHNSLEMDHVKSLSLFFSQDKLALQFESLVLHACNFGQTVIAKLSHS
ncbi:hypothetical protein Ciccas_007503 [Cichlidogyrus casuarinus]|uniref:XPG N-terminal domain-containing protein n=1 Tax=Cichlidogyrus casuarinus TaxID=1844966 RepID=A0ABD2Q2V1_9PLAT